MPVLSKPYVITDAGRQSEDIDRMFDDVYDEMAELERANAERLSGAGGAGGGARGLPGNDGDDADAQWPILVTDTDIARLRLANAFLATNTFAGLSQFNGECSFTSEPITFAGVITTSQGARFPSLQVASTNVNTLDDYEEASWTPVIGGSSGQSGQTYVIQVGRSVKCGKLVLAQFHAELSAKGTVSGNVQIQGLPYTVENVTSLFSTSTLLFSGLATNWVEVVGRPDTNASYANVFGHAAAANNNYDTALTTIDLDDSLAFQGTFIYRASS